MTASADVCLLLEGTYPFVRGGVSSWVHQLLEGLPELRFSLVFVGGRRSDYGNAHYRLPGNVVHLETHFLEDGLKQIKRSRARKACPHMASVTGLHDYLKRARAASAGDAYARDLEGGIDTLFARLEQPRGLGIADFLTSSDAWQLIRSAHLDGPDASFVDYFWTLRFMHGPIFQLARIARGIPKARAFHAISTGYAGFLGALLHGSTGRPLVLSEHGIYTKERRIDLNHAGWLDPIDSDALSSAWGSSAPLRELWIRFFESLGRLTYRAADPIISLYEGNRRRQVQDGAAPERTRVIVNGIAAERFESALQKRPDRTPRIIALLGRVVPIKDVKTFVRAHALIRAQLPDVEAWVVGSAEEDPAYAQECRALARSLNVADHVRFLGHQSVEDVLPQLGLVMLSSISEAQPLVVLEAFAAGVPCVVTDVGACRELIEGRAEDDRALGVAGRVVPFADAEALARAAVELLSSEQQYRACQRAGLERVRRHYAVTDMLEAYRQVYRQALRR